MTTALQKKRARLQQLTDQQTAARTAFVAEIERQHSLGRTYADIAEEIGLTKQRVIALVQAANR